MKVTPEITFRDMATSQALAARIRRRVAELEQFFDRIVSCRVVVECRHPRRQQGNLFHVGIDLNVPSREIVAAAIRRSIMGMRMPMSPCAMHSMPPAGCSKIMFASSAAT